MAEKFSVLTHDSEDARENDPQGPPIPNIFAAADYIARLLSANDVPWAVMGGFAMMCRGSARVTHDIDIVTQSSMRNMWRIIEPQNRLKIPDTKLIDGVIKVFVKTGPTYRDPMCIEDRDVEVDLVMPGSKGTPLDLSSHRETLQIQVYGQNRVYYALNILYMLRTKLRHLTTRAFARDLADLMYLLNHYSSDIIAVREQLDAGDIEMFFARPEIGAQDSKVQGRWRQVLGREKA